MIIISFKIIMLEKKPNNFIQYDELLEKYN